MMDWDGKIEASKLVCAATGAQIAAGSLFWSALLVRDGRFVRQDYDDAAWSDVPRESFISWWRQKAPLDAADRPKTIDAEALLHIFHALKDSTQRPQQCFAYIVLLFLVRGRKLRFRDTVRDGDQSYLIVEDRANRCTYKVRDPAMSTAEADAVQANLLDIIDVGAGSGSDPG